MREGCSRSEALGAVKRYRAHLLKRFVSLLHWQCSVERCAVPPLAAALGFTCEGLTAARTERCTMLAMQCSAGHCAMLRAVWSHGTCRAFSCATCRAGHCAMLRAVQRWALCNTARCASQGALHYILVVGLWQRRNSSFRKTHTFGTCYVDTVTCYVDTLLQSLTR